MIGIMAKNNNSIEVNDDRTNDSLCPICANILKILETLKYLL